MNYMVKTLGSVRGKRRRRRRVARDLQPRRECPRDDMFAAMPPLMAKRALFAYVAGVREKRREQGQDEVKLFFIERKPTSKRNVKRKNGSSYRSDSRNVGRMPSVEMVVRDERSSIRVGGRLRMKTGE